MNQTEKNIQVIIDTPITITSADIPIDTNSPITITTEEIQQTNLLSQITQKLKEYYEKINWWGKDTSAQAKKSAHSKIEEERQKIQTLFEQIVIDHNNSWLVTPLDQIGNIDTADEEILKNQIKLLNPPNNTNEDVKIKLLDQATNNPQSNDFQEQEKFRQLQVDIINNIYSNAQEYNTPINFQNHVLQKRIGINNQWSCVPVSCLNALRALDLPNSAEITEENVVQEFGGDKAFNDQGYVNMNAVYHFFINKDLLFRATGNLVDLMQTLQNGGVAVIAFGGHARLISGAFTKNNQVIFRINDPLEENVIEMPINELIKHLNFIPRYYSLYLIEKKSS